MKLRRLARNTGVGIVVLALLTLLSFALPVRVWRTGELPAPPLPLVEDGPRVELPAHTWIEPMPHAVIPRVPIPTTALRFRFSRKHKGSRSSASLLCMAMRQLKSLTALHAN